MVNMIPCPICSKAFDSSKSTICPYCWEKEVTKILNNAFSMNLKNPIIACCEKEHILDTLKTKINDLPFRYIYIEDLLEMIEDLK